MRERPDSLQRNSQLTLAARLESLFGKVFPFFLNYQSGRSRTVGMV